MAKPTATERAAEIGAKSNRKVAIIGLLSATSVAVIAGIFTLFRPSGEVGSTAPGLETSVEGSPAATVVAASDSTITINQKPPEKASLADDDPSPPKIGAFEAKADGSTFIQVKNKSGAVVTVPITLIIDVPRKEPRHYDYTMTFDITNVAKTDMRITEIAFVTTNWSPLPKIIKYIPLSGLGDVKKFFGVIDKDRGDYPCGFTQEDKYVVLKPGELDTIEVAINAKTPGIYSGRVVVDYSVGGKEDRLAVSELSDLYFVDRPTAFSAPR